MNKRAWKASPGRVRNQQQKLLITTFTTLCLLLAGVEKRAKKPEALFLSEFFLLRNRWRARTPIGWNAQGRIRKPANTGNVRNASVLKAVCVIFL
jgi:hypothetical protein